MSLGQILGEARLRIAQLEDGDSTPAPRNTTLVQHAAPAQHNVAKNEPAKNKPPVYGVVDQIRKALRASGRPMTCAEIVRAIGNEMITATKVGTNIANMRDVEKGGERGSYRYRLIGK